LHKPPLGAGRQARPPTELPQLHSRASRPLELAAAQIARQSAVKRPRVARLGLQRFALIVTDLIGI
jgi:hypothetical protein